MNCFYFSKILSVQVGSELDLEPYIHLNQFLILPFYIWLSLSLSLSCIGIDIVRFNGLTGQISFHQSAGRWRSHLAWTAPVPPLATNSGSLVELHWRKGRTRMREGGGTG